MTLARVLWLQGFADQSMRTVQRAVDDALSIQHALSLCNLLGSAACSLAIATGDLVAADRFTAMLTHHAGRHGADVWVTYGRCFKGMLLIKRDQLDLGASILRAAVAELRAARFVHYTAFLAALAEGLDWRRRGGGTVSASSMRRSRNRTRRRSAGFLPSCYVSRASSFCYRSEPTAATVAAGHFQQSLEWARRQGALHGNCEAQRAWRGCGIGSARPARRAQCWEPCTADSQRVLTPPTS